MKYIWSNYSEESTKHPQLGNFEVQILEYSVKYSTL